MTMTDPLGDMLTRIRNAADAEEARGHDAGLEASRARARRAPGARAISAATRKLENDGQAPELEIELKYYDGEPVIREIEPRVASPGRRVYASVKNIPRGQQRSGRLHPLDAEGRDVGCRGALTRTSAARCSAGCF